MADGGTKLLRTARRDGVWPWASNDKGDPEVVMACGGDVPTLEAAGGGLPAARQGARSAHRMVNVVDLMTLQPTSEHPHGLPDEEYDQIFRRPRRGVCVPRYPWVFTGSRIEGTTTTTSMCADIREEATTTTPFDMSCCRGCAFDT